MELFSNDLLVSVKKSFLARHWWLTPITLATQVAEIKRTVV
jgi:uncharacterized membrane protein